MPSTIEKFSEHALKGVEAELERLLCVETRLVLDTGSLVRSSDFIDQLAAESIAVKLEMDGAPEGNGVMAVTRRDAIRLAGKLLMLPAGEINQSIADGEYDKEYRFAFGEIVKSFVRTFILSLPETSYRCVEITCRERQVDSRSDVHEFLGSLSDNQFYYSATISFFLGGVPLDGIRLLLPAIMVVESCTSESGLDGSLEVDRLSGSDMAPASSHDNTPLEVWEKADSALFDTFLDHWVRDVSRELKGAFGATVVRAERGLRVIDEQQIRAQCADMNMLFGSYRVEGPMSCTLIALADFDDVVRIGALPGQIAAPAVQQSPAPVPPDSDLQDGFHELTTVLVSHWSEKLSGMEKDSVNVARGISVLMSGSEALPSFSQFQQGEHWLAQHLLIGKDGSNRGEICLLIPAVFIERFATEMVFPGSSTREHAYADSGGGRSTGVPIEEVSERYETGGGQGKILLVSASDRISGALRGVFDEEGFLYDSVSSTSGKLQQTIMEHYESVFLVVEQADEIAFSTIIKISSSCAAPLVVAAPQWTQSQVVKALRYGAVDIMLTPFDGAELREKVRELYN